RRQTSAPPLSFLRVWREPRGSPPSVGPSVCLGQLVQYGGVLERRDILRDFLALRHDTQQTPHDFPRTGLREVFAKPYISWLGDRPDFFGHPITQLLGDGDGLVPF